MSKPKSLRTENSVFINRFCPQRHDKTILGVYKDYSCRACKGVTSTTRQKPRKRKEECIHGHNRIEEGISKHGMCLACKREKNRHWRHPGLDSVVFRYCARLHDKQFYGVSASGQCLKCKSIQAGIRRGTLEDPGADRSKWIYLSRLKTIREELDVSSQRMASYCRLDITMYFRLEESRMKASMEAQQHVLQGVVRAMTDVIRERRRVGDIYGRGAA